MATAVWETKERVDRVSIEGLALLKLVKHCHESLPTMVTGSLLGMTNGQGLLEITHAFPFPDSNLLKQQQQQQAQQKDKNATNEGTTTPGTDSGDDAIGLEGHEFQLEMMRMLREVNVDNNCVGWYQSMYLGIFSTSNLLENQLSYQTDLSPNAVVILYDPMQTTNGNMVLKCFRLSDETVRIKLRGANSFIPPRSIFEEIPLTLSNPGLVRALLADLADGIAHPNNATTDSFKSKSGLYDMAADTTLDRLDMSTNPYLEKHFEFLSGWVEELALEHGKFQYYTRQIARGTSTADKSNNNNNNRKQPRSKTLAEDAADAWESNEAPRRMESLLISNQIFNSVHQMDQFLGSGLSKLYLAGGLHSLSRKKPHGH